MNERIIKNKRIVKGVKSTENLSPLLSIDAEGQFINSKDLYCKAIENADGVPFKLIFDSRTGEGHFVKIGTGIKQLLGISIAEFNEKVFHNMVDEIIPLSENLPSELSAVHEKFLNGEIESYKAEILIRMPGGERKWILYTALPLIDEETKKVMGAFGILFDINESKVTLNQLKRATEKAIESDRLKNAFLSNMSHEIRTPLNAIVGFSTLLSEPEITPDDQQKFLDILLRSADHLLEIVMDIVEISNIETEAVKARKGLINVNTTLNRIYNRFSVKAREKNISLRLFPAQGNSDINLFTDGFKFSQILTNLLDNAIKFTVKGEVEFGYSINNDKIKFFISDTGIGIPPEISPMVFSRFYQAESSPARRFEGTGLGLTISKAYIELLGGEIWFTSQPGEGSVFYFTLPYKKMEGKVNFKHLQP
ncbi:MAG: HAMP domain-containing histidine kinase [Bacteroidales bacterium]|jgi:signal transduction histidine kinase|nr:HAMP domain-containing histidine kinase [Bacteroidales bacterium]